MKKLILLIMILALVVTFGAFKQAIADEVKALGPGETSRNFYENKALAIPGWDFSTDMLYNFKTNELEAGIGKDLIVLFDFMRIRGEVSGPMSSEIFSDSKVGLGPGVDIRALATKWGANWNIPEWAPRVGVLAMTNINKDFMKKFEVMAYIELLRVPVDKVFNRVEKVFTKSSPRE